MSVTAVVAASLSGSEVSAPGQSLPELGVDDFTLFQLPHRFAQSAADIDLRWKDLLRQAHPDRFAAQGAAAQRVAMQWAVRINEAYQRLKNPVKRAAYLCELSGAPIQAESNTAMPAAFLMQQMAWREALEDATDLDTLEDLHDQVLQAKAQALALCETCLDQQHDPASAAQQVRGLMFIERFLHDIETRIDHVDPR
jgi:molecular chaperone HscB